MIPLETGLIQVYTGNGKGKTTVALGLALRAIGHGARVLMIQFLKGSSYAGELFSAPRLHPQLTIVQFGWGCPESSLIRSGQAHCKECGECFRQNRDPQKDFVPKAWEYALQEVNRGEYDLVILDEISHALRHGLLSLADFLPFLDKKPAHVELVLTGRAMPPEVIEKAHLVSEIMEIKHPFQQGIKSRRGIEY